MKTGLSIAGMAVLTNLFLPINGALAAQTSHAGAWEAVSQVTSFEKLGIGWCDEVLARYEDCLRSITYSDCEVIAQKRDMSRTYGQPGPGYQPRTYRTPAAACMAEVQDLRAEMKTNVMVAKTIIKRKPQLEEFCVKMKEIIEKNSRALFCKVHAGPRP